jgi:hypothetical protein
LWCHCWSANDAPEVEAAGQIGDGAMAMIANAAAAGVQVDGHILGNGN